MKQLFVVVALALLPTLASAQPLLLQNDIPVGAFINGFAPLKVNLSATDSPYQPWPGDAVALNVFADDTLGRHRLWASVFSLSTYTGGPGVHAATELDLNNLSHVDPNPPGGLRSSYGAWVTGTSNTPHVGSAAVLVTAFPPARWYTGLYLDQVDVGVQLGGTTAGIVGVDLAQTRLRFTSLTAPPDPTPVGSVELYAQHTATGKVQLIARFAGSWLVIATEP